MKINKQEQRLNYRLAMTLIFFIFFSGCIRLTGNAGYWHKGANDAELQSKQVGFDTNDYVPGAPAPGNITREDS